MNHIHSCLVISAGWISNSEAAKKYIFKKTGMVPAIYENETLFVTNQKLSMVSRVNHIYYVYVGYCT